MRSTASSTRSTTSCSTTAASIHANDSETFEAVYRENYRYVFLFVLRMVRDRELAEDLAQSTFLNAWRAWPGYESRANVSTWLAAIAKNQVLNHLRYGRQRRHPAGATDSLNDDRVRIEVGRTGAAEIRTALHEALLSLSPKELTAFRLRYIDGLSEKEITKTGGMTREALKTRAHRARARLRERLWRHQGRTFESRLVREQ